MHTKFKTIGKILDQFQLLQDRKTKEKGRFYKFLEDNGYICQTVSPNSPTEYAIQRGFAYKPEYPNYHKEENFWVEWNVCFLLQSLGFKTICEQNDIRNKKNIQGKYSKNGNEFVCHCLPPLFLSRNRMWEKNRYLVGEGNIPVSNESFLMQQIFSQSYHKIKQSMNQVSNNDLDHPPQDIIDRKICRIQRLPFAWIENKIPELVSLYREEAKLEI